MQRFWRQEKPLKYFYVQPQNMKYDSYKRNNSQNGFLPASPFELTIKLWLCVPALEVVNFLRWANFAEK